MCQRPVQKFSILHYSLRKMSNIFIQQMDGSLKCAMQDSGLKSLQLDALFNSNWPQLSPLVVHHLTWNFSSNLNIIFCWYMIKQHSYVTPILFSLTQRSLLKQGVFKQCMLNSDFMLILRSDKPIQKAHNIFKRIVGGFYCL